MQYVTILKPADGRDCTNNGISKNAQRLLIVNVEGSITQAHPDDTCAALVQGNLRGTARIVPVKMCKETGDWSMVGGTMFGSNYAASSDGRFGDAVERITGARFYGAVAIHDRVE